MRHRESRLRRCATAIGSTITRCAAANVALPQVLRPRVISPASPTEAMSSPRRSATAKAPMTPPVTNAARNTRRCTTTSPATLAPRTNDPNTTNRANKPLLRLGDPMRLIHGATPNKVETADTTMNGRNHFHRGHRRVPVAAHTASPAGTSTQTASHFTAWNGPNAAGRNSRGTTTTRPTGAIDLRVACRARTELACTFGSVPVGVDIIEAYRGSCHMRSTHRMRPIVRVRRSPGADGRAD